MKKILAIMLAGAITFGYASVGIAAGNIQTAAPGQAANFNKGVTTIVTLSNEVATPYITTEFKNQTEVRLTDSRVDSGEPVISVVSVVDYNNIVGIETHPQHAWTKNLYSTIETTTTTTPNKKVDTYASFDVKYERTVSTYYQIKRTIQHQGAPGSNGKVLSDVSEEIITRVVYGEWTEVSSTEIAGTSYIMETKLADDVTSVSKTTTTKSKDWIKEDGTPSTTPQGGN